MKQRMKSVYHSTPSSSSYRDTPTVSPLPSSTGTSPNKLSQSPMSSLITSSSMGSRSRSLSSGYLASSSSGGGSSGFTPSLTSREHSITSSISLTKSNVSDVKVVDDLSSLENTNNNNGSEQSSSEEKGGVCKSSSDRDDSDGKRGGGGTGANSLYCDADESAVAGGTSSNNNSPPIEEGTTNGQHSVPPPASMDVGTTQLELSTSIERPSLVHRDSCDVEKDVVPLETEPSQPKLVISTDTDQRKEKCLESGSSDEVTSSASDLYNHVKSNDKSLVVIEDNGGSTWPPLIESTDDGMEIEDEKMNETIDNEIGNTQTSFALRISPSQATQLTKISSPEKASVSCSDSSCKEGKTLSEPAIASNDTDKKQQSMDIIDLTLTETSSSGRGLQPQSISSEATTDTRSNTPPVLPSSDNIQETIDLTSPGFNPPVSSINKIHVNQQPTLRQDKNETGVASQQSDASSQQTIEVPSQFDSHVTPNKPTYEGLQYSTVDETPPLPGNTPEGVSLVVPCTTLTSIDACTCM